MNGVINPEADDYSEFVEVDPTGRYGRVLKLLSQFLSLWLSLFFLASDLGSDSWVPFFFWLFGCSTMKYLERELQRQCTDWALCFAVIFFMPVYFRYLLILGFFSAVSRFFFLFFFVFLKFFGYTHFRFLQILSFVGLQKDFFQMGFWWICDWLVVFLCLIGAVTEHSMSMKALKLLGTRSSFMISCKALKILRGSTVKFISLKQWNTITLWSSILLGLILLIGTSILSLRCSLLGLSGSKYPQARIFWSF